MLDQVAIRPLLTSEGLTTERLHLRPLTPADAPRLAELANDFEVVKMTGGMPYPYGLADAETFIRRATDADPDREVHFAVELVGEGPVGCVGFYPHDAPGPELGYWLGQPFWGRGIATEMLAAIMDWARDGWGRRCVVACHQQDNIASGAVLIKAGFLYTGRMGPWPCRSRGLDVPTRWMVWLA